MLVLSIYYRNIWENMYDPFIVPISGHVNPNTTEEGRERRRSVHTAGTLIMWEVYEAKTVR